MPTTNTRDVLSNGNMYSAWNPILLISMKIPTVVTNSAADCVMSIHWQFDVTLRGLRKVPTTDMSLFKPYAGFIGYKTDNVGLCIKGYNVDTYYVVTLASDTTAPSINPEYNPTTVPPSTGLVVPNDGLPGSNINI